MKIGIIYFFVVLFLAVAFYSPTPSFLNTPNPTGVEYTQMNPFSDPIQENFSSLMNVDLKKNSGVFKMSLLAKYKITAMLKCKTNYYSGWYIEKYTNWYGEIAPIDLGLVWGKLIYPENDKYMRYHHGFM